jgi:hypothetical protein
LRIVPFTLSHPAAILPFLSRSKSFTWKVGLVVGAMTPDLWFLLPGLASRNLSHGRFGILLDPPAALLLAWIAVHWVLPSLSRLPGLDALDRKEPFQWGMGYLGASIGVATHLVWDQFTHGGSRLLANPVFSTAIYRHGPLKLDLGQLIWYLNSLVGSVILILWLHNRMRTRKAGSSILFSRQWALVGLGFLVPVAMGLAWLSDESLSGPGGVRRAIEMGREMRVAGFLAVMCAVLVGILSTRWSPSVQARGEEGSGGNDE